MPEQRPDAAVVSSSLGVQLQSGNAKKYARFFVSAFGSLPWIGGLIAAAAAMSGETDQGRVNDLQRQWMESHDAKIKQLMEDLATIAARLDKFGAAAEQRVNDEDYLTLTRQAFQVWDKAATREKRDLIRTLLLNAGATTLASDDVVRLFIDWIDKYHEAHFAVIKAIYREPGITRNAIWSQIRGVEVREDSADADLFKLLVRDLSTGGVLRQERSTTAGGEFVARQRGPRRPAAHTLKSAFDNSEPYVLTALGEQFVHYCISDLAPQLSGDEAGANG